MVLGPQRSNLVKMPLPQTMYNIVTGFQPVGGLSLENMH